MKLRTAFGAILLAMITMGIASTAGSTIASAQCCPTYSVVIGNTLPATCFPATVTTSWANGISGTTVSPAPGTVTLAAPVPPGCWGQPLTGLVINGTVIPLPAVLPPCLPPVNIGCAVVRICFIRTATGCLAIAIS